MSNRAFQSIGNDEVNRVISELNRLFHGEIPQNVQLDFLKQLFTFFGPLTIKQKKDILSFISLYYEGAYKEGKLSIESYLFLQRIVLSNEKKSNKTFLFGGQNAPSRRYSRARV